MKKSAVTISDIARALGVSEATVSLALNDNTLVKKETREKVKLTAAELGYVPNLSARRLVKKKSGMIGVVVPDIENVYYASLVKELSNRVAEIGCSLSIFISSNDPKKEERAVSDMISSRVEGIIYVPINTPADLSGSRGLIERSGIPSVCATTLIDGMSCVLCDLEDGMKRLMEQINKDAAKKIVCLGGPKGVYTLDCRQKAFLESAKSSGARVKIIHLPEVDYKQAFEAARGLLSDLPDVIVCVNDFMALAVVNLLTGQGIPIPGRVEVTGFDDSVFSIASPVPLTTVRQDIPALAKATVELLNKLIASDTLPDREIIKLPASLIVRQSTKNQKF